MVQTVVGAGNHSLGEKNQWTPGLGQDLDGTLQSLAIHAFAVDAECSHARQNPRQQPVLHEEMPTGDDVEWTTNPLRQEADHHGVARPAVVRCQHDPVAGIHGSLQAIHSEQFVRLNPMTLVEVGWQHESDEHRPEGAGFRRNETIGLIDDDILHA